MNFLDAARHRCVWKPSRRAWQRPGPYTHPECCAVEVTVVQWPSLWKREGSLVTKIKRKKVVLRFWEILSRSWSYFLFAKLSNVHGIFRSCLVDKTTLPQSICWWQKKPEAQRDWRICSSPHGGDSGAQSQSYFKSLSGALDSLLRLAMSISPLSLHISHGICITSGKEMRRSKWITIKIFWSTITRFSLSSCQKGDATVDDMKGTTECAFWET